MPSDQVISDASFDLLEAYMDAMQATIAATIATLSAAQAAQSDDKLKLLVRQVVDKANSAKAAIDELAAIFRSAAGHGTGDPSPAGGVDHRLQ